MVYRPPYQWYIEPLTHGISTPLSMVFWPPTHRISTPYTWYFDLPAYFFIINGGVQNTMGFNLPYRGGSVFNKGVQYTMDVNRPRVQFTMGFKIPYDTGFVTRLIRRVPLVEQELLTLPEHLSSPPVFSGVRVTRSLVLYTCLFCRSLFVLLYFFFWPLCCLFFFDIRILITPLVSSNSSSCKMLALYFTYENYCGYIYFLEYQF
jgi:hypothetical protein